MKKASLHAGTSASRVEQPVDDGVGNLVKIDAPYTERLRMNIGGTVKRLADMHPQSVKNLRGTLFSDSLSV